MKAGWKTAKLEAVCDKITDGSHFSPKTTESGFPYVTVRDIGNDQVDFDNCKFVCEADFNQLLKNGCKPNRGDVLFSKDGTVGKVALVDYEKNFVVLSSLAIVRPDNELIDSAFLKYVMKSPAFLEEAVGKKTGVAIRRIILRNLKSIPVPVPPLPEQQRIVGILDEAFEGLATATANAEKNLQNARALFDSHLQSVFSQRGKGWVEKSFEEVCHKITDGTHHSPQTQFPESGPGRFPYITSKNIRNNYMDLSNVVYIERAFHDEVYARCQPSLGDVLLTKDGANTGTVTLNTLDEPFSLLSSVCLIKTNHAVLKPAFLCYYLQSSTGLSSIVGQMTGAAIKRIVLKDIKKAGIPFPPLKEQDRIITTLDSLLTETQRLVSLYQQKLDALDALKKSLLHQAFTGEL